MQENIWRLSSGLPADLEAAAHALRLGGGIVCDRNLIINDCQSYKDWVSCKVCIEAGSHMVIDYRIYGVK